MSNSMWCWDYLGENPKNTEVDGSVFNMLTGWLGH